jgi:hypothetical protein
MEVVLVGALDLLHMVAIPVNSHHPINQQMIRRANARHRIFEEERITHGFVGSRA